MSNCFADTKLHYFHDDKENSVGFELLKKGKGELTEKPETINTLGRIDEDQD